MIRCLPRNRGLAHKPEAQVKDYGLPSLALQACARYFLASVIPLCLLCCVVPRVRAVDDPPPDRQEPPVLLKKKPKPPRPEPAPEKKDESPRRTVPEKEEPLPEEDPEEKAQEILGRVSKNMRAAEDRLDKKDAGNATQQLQRDILKDLDELIAQSGRQQQQQQQQQQQEQQQQQDRQQAARQQRAGSQRAQGQRQQQAKGSRSQQNTAMARQPTPTTRTTQPQAGDPRNARSRPEGMNKIADLYKDVWGHLPETLRQEMDQYAREQFMPKYQDLLKQYYATVAEKGRRKGE
jgi:hypothetical protein